MVHEKMINYSLTLRPNPMDEEADKKWYASPQYEEVIDLPTFAKHIQNHGCVYSRADIQAVLTMAVDCIHELILEGRKVQLGDLGSFWVKFKSKGKLNAADFLPESHIKAVNPRFEAGKLLRNLKEEASFHQVPSRKIQAATIKALNGEKTPGSSGSKKQSTATITISTKTGTGVTGNYSNA